MKTNAFMITLTLTVAMSIVAACRHSNSSGGEKVIKSAKSGEMTIALAAAGENLKRGENELIVTFTDASGQLVDAGAVSLNFHMAAMGSMAEMNHHAALTTTETAGKYRAQVNIAMAGAWEAQVKYQGQHGTGQVSMSVQAK